MHKFSALLQEASNVEFKDYIHSYRKQENDVHGWRINKYDPEADLSTIRLPFLSIMGEKDSWYRMQPMKH